MVAMVISLFFPYSLSFFIFFTSFWFSLWLGRWSICSSSCCSWVIRVHIVSFSWGGMVFGSFFPNCALVFGFCLTFVSAPGCQRSRVWFGAFLWLVDGTGCHGPLARYVNCGLRVRRECRERFPRHRFQRKPLVRDPGMHHGTCVSHVPWCMSGSLTRGGGENIPGIPGACATRNFTYLVRGPLGLVMTCWVYQLASAGAGRLSFGRIDGLPFGKVVRLPFGRVVRLPFGRAVRLPFGRAVSLPFGRILRLPFWEDCDAAFWQGCGVAS